jgi:hypothetical protein
MDRQRDCNGRHRCFADVQLHINRCCPKSFNTGRRCRTWGGGQEQIVRLDIGPSARAHFVAGSTQRGWTQAASNGGRRTAGNGPALTPHQFLTPGLYPPPNAVRVRQSIGYLSSRSQSVGPRAGHHPLLGGSVGVSGNVRRRRRVPHNAITIFYGIRQRSPRPQHPRK